MSEGSRSEKTGFVPTLPRVSSPAMYSAWLTPLLLTLYFSITMLLFFYWVNPSLVGENNHQIAADSSKYMYFADALRKGNPDPYVIGALYSFPNTSWGPVLLALLLPDTFHLMMLNLSIFGVCLWLFSRSVDLNSALFVFLLVLNPTTTISLLAVNKELLDLLSLALFLWFLRSSTRTVLLLALVLSLVSRYETAITMLIFLFLRSSMNPWRGRRYLTLAAYCVFLDIAIAALLASPTQAYRLAEAEMTSAYSGGTFLILNNLEQHFLFILAVVPKILENLFAEVFNVSHWFEFSTDNPANTFIVFGNNLANLVLVLLVLVRRRFSLRSSLIYYAALIAITMSVSVVIQPRYFYCMYALLCMEAARKVPQLQPDSNPAEFALSLDTASSSPA